MSGRPRSRISRSGAADVDERQRGRPGRGGQHGEAGSLEVGAQHLAELLLILDDEHRAHRDLLLGRGSDQRGDDHHDSLDIMLARRPACRDQPIPQIRGGQAPVRRRVQRQHRGPHGQPEVAVTVVQRARAVGEQDPHHGHPLSRHRTVRPQPPHQLAQVVARGLHAAIEPLGSGCGDSRPERCGVWARIRSMLARQPRPLLGPDQRLGPQRQRHRRVRRRPRGQLAVETSRDHMSAQPVPPGRVRLSTQSRVSS